MSYGQMLAASGFTAVTFNHCFYGAPGGELPDAAGDVAAAVAHVRQRADELGVDRKRWRAAPRSSSSRIPPASTASTS